MKLHVLCPLVICNFFDDALISQSEVKSLEVEWLYNSFQCILILGAWYASETFFVNTAIQKKKTKQDCILSSGCILWPRLSLLLHPCLSVALHQPSLCMCSQENSVLNLLKDWGLRELPNIHLFFFQPENGDSIIARDHTLPAWFVFLHYGKAHTKEVRSGFRFLFRFLLSHSDLRSAPPSQSQVTQFN